MFQMATENLWQADWPYFGKGNLMADKESKIHVEGDEWQVQYTQKFIMIVLKSLHVH